MVRFEYMDKAIFPKLSAAIFRILATNMSVIAPTGNKYDEDFAIWYGSVLEGLLKESREIILIRDNADLIGFFQYYINDSLFMMEEVQILAIWHGKENIFRRLYEFVIPNLSGVEIVEAYANKQNEKSKHILERLGLTIIGENKNGKSYHYCGRYSALLDWLNG